MLALRVTLMFLGLSPPAHAQMDLHAHLVMKPGMGHLLTGDFDSDPQSKNWTDRLKTKVTAKNLNPLQSPSLIVMTLYGHPYFSVTENGATLLPFDRKQNVQLAIEAEYQEIVKFVATHPSFVIAKTPTEAENILADKRIPIVLSIEGAYGTVETEADLRKWVDERGVAIITPFHLTEDHLGGTALMPGIKGFFTSPLDYLRALLITGGKCFFNVCESTIGMTAEGRSLVERLVARKVWVDLAHANHATIRELVPLFKEKKMPILVTHTSPLEVFPAERAYSGIITDAIADLDGIVGIIPTDDMIYYPWGPEQKSSTNDCFSSLLEFRKTIEYMVKVLGPERVALASDINAPLTGLSPLCGTQPSGRILSPLEKEGFYTYTQWRDLAQYVGTGPEWSEKSLQHFLKLWKQVKRPSQ